MFRFGSNCCSDIQPASLKRIRECLSSDRMPAALAPPLPSNSGAIGKTCLQDVNFLSNLRADILVRVVDAYDLTLTRATNGQEYSIFYMVVQDKHGEIMQLQEFFWEGAYNRSKSLRHRYDTFQVGF